MFQVLFQNYLITTYYYVVKSETLVALANVKWCFQAICREFLWGSIGFAFQASSTCQSGLSPNDYKMPKGQHTHTRAG